MVTSRTSIAFPGTLEPNRMVTPSSGWTRITIAFWPSSSVHLRSQYGNPQSNRGQPPQRSAVHRSSHPPRQSRVFPERFQVRPRRRFPILLRRTTHRFLPPPDRVLRPLPAPLARRALPGRFPHPQRMDAPPPLPRRSPPMGIPPHRRLPFRRRPPRRSLPQRPPRIHAPAPPHHPDGKILQRLLRPAPDPPARPLGRRGPNRRHGRPRTEIG